MFKGRCGDLLSKGEVRKCPKCSGEMEEGSLPESRIINETFVIHGNTQKHKPNNRKSPP